MKPVSVGIFRFLRFAVAACTSIVSVGSALAAAEELTLALRLSNREMAQQADLIAIGECVGVKSQWIEGDLVTLATVAVAEVMKGEERPTVTVVLPGGVDATRKVKVGVSWPGAPTIRPQEEVFLFLAREDMVPDGFAVMGFAQGKLTITEDRPGSQTVSRDLTQLRLQDGAKVVRGSSTEVTLAEFKEEIRSYLQPVEP